MDSMARNHELTGVIASPPKASTRWLLNYVFFLLGFSQGYLFMLGNTMLVEVLPGPMAVYFVGYLVGAHTSSLELLGFGYHATLALGLSL
ncbi:hypothetical protein B0H67DRAFT_641038 [Lasiosphaeris hirsuta]|uniref:Uncharacterized protein n=1 Tax=Lasiosphaeris hirsuta TaxID=260670 RepID=A0AA40E2E1_9PEZI|nr:hypothetical protein B0H67DRAFT_641038 [Lasiosphaeris hirsuta]